MNKLTTQEKLERAKFEAWVRKAYSNFVRDRSELEDAIYKATKASWGGSGYSLELFPDGDWRVLWNEEIGNLYDSRGLIVGIPALSDDEFDEEQQIAFFDSAIEDLDDLIEKIIADGC